MIAKLHIIIGSGGGSTGQLIRGTDEALNNLIANLAGERLEDGGFIQHHTNKLVSGEMIQLFIVGDADTVLHISLRSADFAGNTKLITFALCLFHHGEGSHNQHFSAREGRHLMRPFQLNDGLAGAAIGEHRRTSLGKRPAANIALEAEQVRIERSRIDIKAHGFKDEGFVFQKIVIFHTFSCFIGK